MRRNIRRTILIVAVLALASFVSAMSLMPLQQAGPSAAEILAWAVKQFRQQQGVHFSGVERNYNPLLDITAEGNIFGTYRTSGDIHFQVSDASHQFENEIYVVGKQTFSREPHTDRWREGAKPNEALASVLPLSQTYVLALPLAWMEAALAIPGRLALTERVLPEGRIPCRVIEFVADGESLSLFADALNKALGGGQQQALHPAATSNSGLKFQASFWLAKQGLLIQRLEVHLVNSYRAAEGAKLEGGRPSLEFRDTLSVNYRDYNNALEMGMPVELNRLVNPDRANPQALRQVIAKERALVGHSGAELLEKAWEKSLHQPGYRFQLDSDTNPLKRTFSADGIFRQDGLAMIGVYLAYNEMRARYFIKGDRIAMTVPSLENRCFPFQLDRDLEKSHPHPTMLLLGNFGREARALAADMKRAVPEELNGRLCYALEYTADTPELAKRSSLLQWDARVSDGSWPEFPLTGLHVMRGMDGWYGEGVSEQVSKLRWRVWIGYEDGLIYRLQREVATRVELSEGKWNSLGAQFRNGRPYRSAEYVTTIDLQISEYNANLEFDIPSFVPPCLGLFRTR